MAARMLILLLAAGLAAGCRGTNGQERDFLSTNRLSRSFLRETMREGRKLSRENLKRDLAFGDRFAANHRERKRSLRFARTSVFADERSNLRHAWADLKDAFRFDSKEIRASMVFGLLDSGEG